ncbi:MAG: ribosomal L7Ae/L30e/S12e/Gadd45 family protein [Hydrogenoanaerobacterium sp.]
MNKLLSMVSLCKRAGKLQVGYDRVADTVRNGEALLVFTTSDLSEKTRKGIDFICEAENIESFVMPITMDELEFEIGKRTGIIAVTEQGLAKKLKTMCAAGQINKEDIIL